MVLYNGLCRSLNKKVDFNVEDVISMNTTRGIKWRVKGNYEGHNISTFCSETVAKELLSKLPLTMDAEIAYTPPSETYQSEELIPSFSTATHEAESGVPCLECGKTYSIAEYDEKKDEWTQIWEENQLFDICPPCSLKVANSEDNEAEEVSLHLHEQIQENTNAYELDLHSEKLPSKYYKKDGSLDMRYKICKEYAAKQAESQNAVELEAPYTPIKPERPSDDSGGRDKNRRKPRRPLDAEDKCECGGKILEIQRCVRCGAMADEECPCSDIDITLSCASCGELFDAESFEADVESVVSQLRKLGMPEIVFDDDEERIKINGELVYQVSKSGRNPLFHIGELDYPLRKGDEAVLYAFQPPVWLRTPKGLIKRSLNRNEILERKIHRRLMENYGEYAEKKPFECLCGKRFKSENALKKHQRDKKHPTYHTSHTLFDDKTPIPIIKIENPDGITLREVNLMFPNWNGDYAIWKSHNQHNKDGGNEPQLKTSLNYFNAESFKADGIDALRTRMKILKDELYERKKNLHDKHDSDIAKFGKALGDKKLRDRIKATEKKILKIQAKIDAKFKLSYRDNKVLKEVRSNDPTGNTTSENTYRFDHRYSGSGLQRRKAKESFGADSDWPPEIFRCPVCGSLADEDDYCPLGRIDRTEFHEDDDGTIERCDHTGKIDITNALDSQLHAESFEAEIQGCCLCGDSTDLVGCENRKCDELICKACIIDPSEEVLCPSCAYSAESFEADDTKEDSLKYSYGGFQSEEVSQEANEVVYAEGVPKLQDAEAGIEAQYIQKKDEFMNVIVDDGTLYKLMPDLPAIVEISPSPLAGYNNLRFNFVENPDMEQKILSYAYTIKDNSEEEDNEPEYRAGDVRNRLFNVEFDDWAEQEMLTHGDDVSFKEWADEESDSHGDEEFIEWADHEEESHDERYGAEDFTMQEADRYELGDNIITLSTTLKKLMHQDNTGNWDWQNVKKIGKGIKQGDFNRVKGHMDDIDIKTRRVLWDEYHEGLLQLFTNTQLHALAIPWVTDGYEAEGSVWGLRNTEAYWNALFDEQMADWLEFVWANRYNFKSTQTPRFSWTKGNPVGANKTNLIAGLGLEQGTIINTDKMYKAWKSLSPIIQDTPAKRCLITYPEAVQEMHIFLDYMKDVQYELGYEDEGDLFWGENESFNAEIGENELKEMINKFHKTIDSYTKGHNYTKCSSCEAENKVDSLEDNDGKILHYYYSCKCGHNDIQDLAYGAESFSAEETRTFKITDIWYDTYDEEAEGMQGIEPFYDKHGYKQSYEQPTPSEMTITLDEDEGWKGRDLDMELADAVSDESGFMVYHYNWDEIFPAELHAESFEAESSMRTGEVGDTAYHWYVDGDETIKDREGEPLINRRMEDEIDDDIQHNIKIFLERGEKKGEAYHEVDDLHDRFDEPQSYGIFYSWGAESFRAEDSFFNDNLQAALSRMRDEVHKINQTNFDTKSKGDTFYGGRMFELGANDQPNKIDVELNIDEGEKGWQYGFVEYAYGLDNYKLADKLSEDSKRKHSGLKNIRQGIIRYYPPKEYERSSYETLDSYNWNIRAINEDCPVIEIIYPNDKLWGKYGKRKNNVLIRPTVDWDLEHGEAQNEWKYDEVYGAESFEAEDIECSDCGGILNPHPSRGPYKPRHLCDCEGFITECSNCGGQLYGDLPCGCKGAESFENYQLLAEEAGGVFLIENNKGFNIEFENGYQVSVKFGAGHYSDNYEKSPIIEMGRYLESSTAEIAILRNGFLIPLDEEGNKKVKGWVPPSIIPPLLTAASEGDEEKIRSIIKEYEKSQQGAESFGAEDTKGYYEPYAFCEWCSDEIQNESDAVSMRGEIICKGCKEAWGEQPADGGFWAESKVELKRDSCCCGATKSKPCACMIEGVMECSAVEPKCPCYAAKDAESFAAELSHADKGMMIWEMVQQNLNNPIAVEGFYATFFGEGKEYYDGMDLVVIEAVKDLSKNPEWTDEMFKEYGLDNCSWCSEWGKKTKYLPTSTFGGGFNYWCKECYEDMEGEKWDAESFEAKRKLCSNCHKQRLTASATYRGKTICATCDRLRKEKNAKSFEATSPSVNEEMILNYLENSHRLIKKYNGPYKYTIKGIAEHFGVARSNISKIIGPMKSEGLIKGVKRRLEDSPTDYGTFGPVSIYYLADKEIMWAESFEGELSLRKLCDTCFKQRLSPSASGKGQTTCATCNRVRRESRRTRDEEIFQLRKKGVPVAEISRRFGISTGSVHRIARRVGEEWRGRAESFAAEEREDVPIWTKKKEQGAEDSSEFIGRVSKNLTMGEKFSIKKNNVRLIFEEAQRPLYPLEVVRLYEQKKRNPNRTKKSARSITHTKGGISARAISRIVKSQPDIFYISRSGIIHYVGGGSMKEYIRDLNPKYFAEEVKNKPPSEEDIMDYLQYSHNFITKYSAPFKYSSWGMIQKYGVSPVSMRAKLRRMERKGLLKSVARNCDDRPDAKTLDGSGFGPLNRRLKIYYHSDAGLINFK